MRKTYLLSVLIFIASFAFGQSRENSELSWIKINKDVKAPNNSKVVTDWITYSGTPSNNIGTGSAADFGCFMHIPTSDLTAHDGRQIQEVMVQIAEPENVESIELRIYEEAGTGTPGTPVFTKAFTPNPDGTAWTTISILPYTIDAT